VKGNDMTTDNEKLILARVALLDARDVVDAAIRQLQPETLKSMLLAASEGLTEAIENTADEIFMLSKQAE